MSQLKINLLPKEILLQRHQSSKVILIKKLSIAMLVVLIAVTGAVLGLRVFQTSDLKKANEELKIAQSKVSSLSDKEIKEILLKQQLDSIGSILGKDTNRRSIFNLVVAIVPKDVRIFDATVDKGGNMSMTLSSESLNSIASLFSDLGNPEKNSGLISKVNIDGLSVGKDGTYRFGLKINAK